MEVSTSEPAATDPVGSAPKPTRARKISHEAALAAIEKTASPELLQALMDGMVAPVCAVNVAELSISEQSKIDYGDKRQVSLASTRGYRAANSGQGNAKRTERRRRQAKREREEKMAHQLPPDDEPVADLPPKQEEQEEPPQPNEQRLYEEGSCLSAFVLAQRAKSAISQLSRNDPNLVSALEGIQIALTRQTHLIMESNKCQKQLKQS